MLKATGAHCLLNDGGPGDLQFLKVLFCRREREKKKSATTNKNKMKKISDVLSAEHQERAWGGYFPTLSSICIDRRPWCEGSRSRGKWNHNAHKKLFEILLTASVLPGSVDYAGIKCVCAAVCVCACAHVFTLSHLYTHTQENTFIGVAGLHRDKAPLLILTHCLNTHTHTHIRPLLIHKHSHM